MRLGRVAAALGAAFIDLVQLHGPGGQRVFVNPAQISTLREPSTIAVNGQHFAKGTRCVIITSNGKYLPVQETCDQVEALVDAAN